MIDTAGNNKKNLSRREREKLAHRHEILDAATRVFAQKGYFNATLDEVAQEAEFSKGTMYLYFSNKEDLLFSIIHDKMEGYLKTLKSTLSGEKSFKQELYECFMNAARVTFKDTDFFTLLMSLHARRFRVFSGEKAHHCQSVHNEVFVYVTDRARKAIDDGELRDIPPEAVNGMIHGALDNMMIHRWNCKTLKELQKSVDYFIDILFNGIAKEKEMSN